MSGCPCSTLVHGMIKQTSFGPHCEPSSFGQQTKMARVPNAVRLLYAQLPGSSHSMLFPAPCTLMNKDRKQKGVFIMPLNERARVDCDRCQASNELRLLLACRWQRIAAPPLVTARPRHSHQRHEWQRKVCAAKLRMLAYDSTQQGCGHRRLSHRPDQNMPCRRRSKQ